jgi:hypothetical protein
MNLADLSEFAFGRASSHVPFCPAESLCCLKFGSCDGLVIVLRPIAQGTMSLILDVLDNPAFSGCSDLYKVLPIAVVNKEVGL